MSTNIVTVEVAYKNEDITLDLNFDKDHKLRWYVDGKLLEIGGFDNVFDAFIVLSQHHLDFTTAGMMKIAEACEVDEDGGCPDRFVIFTADPDHRNNGRVYINRDEAERAVEASFRAGNVGFTLWDMDDLRASGIGIDGDPADAPHGMVIRI